MVQNLLFEYLITFKRTTIYISVITTNIKFNHFVYLKVFYRTFIIVKCVMHEEWRRYSVK